MEYCPTVAAIRSISFLTRNEVNEGEIILSFTTSSHWFVWRLAKLNYRIASLRQHLTEIIKVAFVTT